MHEDLIQRLRKRAEIRLQIESRKSVQEGKPDRLAELLIEAAEALNSHNKTYNCGDPECGYPYGCQCYTRS